MKQIKLFTLSLTCLAFLGCLQTSYTSPSGEKFSRLAIGNKTAIKNLSIQRPDGTSLILEGYSNDQIEGIKAAAEGAAKGAAAGIKP